MKYHQVPDYGDFDENLESLIDFLIDNNIDYESERDEVLNIVLKNDERIAAFPTDYIIIIENEILIAKQNQFKYF